jgi:hypothetical protein
MVFDRSNGIYRSVIIALIGWLILTGNAQPMGDNARGQPAATQGNKSTAQNADIASNIGGIRRAIEAQNAQPDPYEKERNEREIRDLEAQQNSAYWAEQMFWATFVAVVLSVIGIVLIYTTFATARKANEIAREGGVAQDRAWIKLGIQAQYLAVTRDHLVCRAHIETKNVGNSVATDITCWAFLHIGHHGDFMDKKFFNIVEPQFFSSQQSYTIWPNDALFHDRNANGLGIASQTIDGETYRVFLVAKAEYRTIFDKPTDPKRSTELIVEITKPQGAAFVIVDDSKLTVQESISINVLTSTIGSGQVT